MTQSRHAIPNFGLPPWHMWGTSERLTVDNTSGLQSQQLAKLNYKRPDTWSFFLGLRVLNAPNTLPAAAQVAARFDLTIGTGRSSFIMGTPGVATLTGFATLLIQWAAGTNPNGRFKWAVAVPSPALDDSAGTPVTPLCDHFPAQDIQCNALCVAGLGGAAFSAEIEVAAYFAPRSHIRPDWFSDGPAGEQYRGGETGGT